MIYNFEYLIKLIVENDSIWNRFFILASREWSGSLLEKQSFWARRGLEVGWGLAGWPSLLKMLEPKDPIFAKIGVDTAEKEPL